MWFPVAALVATDLLLNRFVYHYATDLSFLFTWAWYAGVVLLGSGMLRKRTTPTGVVGAGLAASISFFLISNFWVWAAGNMYPHNFSGVLTCYTAAVPFFRGTLLGDVLFSVTFFGLPVLVRSFKTANASRMAS